MINSILSTGIACRVHENLIRIVLIKIPSNEKSSSTYIGKPANMNASDTVDAVDKYNANICTTK